MKCTVFVFIGMAAVVMALPVEQQPQIPALDSVLVEATSEVEAVRKARQILGGNFGLLNGGKCTTNYTVKLY